MVVRVATWNVMDRIRNFEGRRDAEIPLEGR